MSYSQLGKNNIFHPIGFHSHKISPTEINYKIHDKELFAFMDAFEKWCHFLGKIQHEIIMYSDHKNL
jgi:hypothetical protein